MAFSTCENKISNMMGLRGIVSWSIPLYPALEGTR